MKLGLLLGYSGRQINIPYDLINQAEANGFDSVWVAEAYGNDTITAASYILSRTEKIKVGTAIMQVPARTPANTAMTAMSLSQLSGGRFILGLGASGPQVVEGWHGQPYAKPVTRLKEYIEIIRKIMQREGPVSFDGEVFQLPYKGPGATGLGKPLKSILEADTSIPIYTASFTPAGYRASAEVADGAIPAFASPEKLDTIIPSLEEGFARAGNGKSFDNFDIAPFVIVTMGDDMQQNREATRQMLALYVGGMGARNKNFYNDYAVKLGYAEAAAKVQDLYLGGKKEAAAAAVPDELIDEVSLVGTSQQIADRAQKWKESGKIKTMIMAIHQPEVMPVLAEAFNG
jgi:F420-dependent oxidoreductase-like protein